MKKKIILSSLAVVAMLAGVVTVSAFEAHVINVTAQIENALSVSPKTITFGTVFPQEHKHHDLDINLSQAFLDEDRVKAVSYRIVQKLHPIEQVYASTTEDISDVVGATGTYYPSLCQYLSKHKQDVDQGQNEVQVDSFHKDRHWATSGHVMYDAIASGYLEKDHDTEDLWDIDLAVPCFSGECAQDWPTFVTGINPLVTDPFEYTLSQDLKEATFMCDLWVEVTAIEEDNSGNTSPNPPSIP